MTKHSLFPLFLAVLLLLSVRPAFAKWSDLVQKAADNVADQQAKLNGQSYTPYEGVAGVREILSSGVEYASKTLSTGKGFAADASTALSLPGRLSGLSGSSSLLSSMNTAAGKAAAGSESAFLSAVKDLSVTDAASLLGTSATSSSSSSSSSTAVTDYFASKSRDSLKPLVKPVVKRCASAAGVDSSLSALSTGAKAAGAAAFDVDDYLTEKVLDGMFHYMGVKETELRQSGGAGASALLQKIL